MMDNERLKDIIDDVFHYTDSRESEYSGEDFDEAENQILALINRRPDDANFPQEDEESYVTPICPYAELVVTKTKDGIRWRVNKRRSCDD